MLKGNPPKRCKNEMKMKCLLIIKQGDLQEEQFAFFFEVSVLSIVSNKDLNLAKKACKRYMGVLHEKFGITER